MTDLRRKEINEFTDRLIRLQIELKYIISDEDESPDRSDEAMDKLEEAEDLFEDLVDALDRASD